MTQNLRSTTVALLAFSLLAFGCKLTNKSRQVSTPPGNRNTSTPTPKPPARVTVTFKPSNNPQKDLAEAMKRLETAYPFRWTFSQNDAKYPAVEFVFEYADRDRLHARDSSGAEYVKIGETGYTKGSSSGGQWELDTVNFNVGAFNANNQLKSLLSQHANVTSIGPEELNGVSCFVYQFPFGRDGVSKTWIGAANGLPYLRDDKSKGFSQRSVFEYVDVEVKNPMDR